MYPLQFKVVFMRVCLCEIEKKLAGTREWIHLVFMNETSRVDLETLEKTSLVVRMRDRKQHPMCDKPIFFITDELIFIPVIIFTK